MSKVNNLKALRKSLPHLTLAILPSSVCPGLGVYALQRLSKGNILGAYPGHLISDEEDELLRDFIQSCVTLIKGDDERTLKEIDTLKGHFGIELVAQEAQTHRLQNQPRILQLADVDWSRVMTALNNYSFQTDAGTLVPAKISYTGNPIYDIEAHMSGSNNASLTPMINEAPPRKFVNLLTGKIQNPAYNVDVVVEGHFVVFYSKRVILPGQELFFFYGPIYDRNYPVNLTPQQCGWDRRDWNDMSSSEKKKTKDFFKKQDRFKLGLATMRQTKQRKVEMEQTITSLLKFAANK